MSNLKILAINGAPSSGKTTFEDILAEKLGAYYRSRSTIDRVKEIALQCGWDGVKTLESRKFLSDLKDLLTQYCDTPMKDIDKHISDFEDELRHYHVEDHPHVFVSDVREPQALQRFKDEYNAITILIHREQAEQALTSNHADANVLNFQYDYIIINNGTLEELEEKADKLLNLLFNKD